MGYPNLLYCNLVVHVPVERQDDLYAALAEAGWPTAGCMPDALEFTLSRKGWCPSFTVDGDLVGIEADGPCAGVEDAEALVRALADFAASGGYGEYAIQQRFGDEPDYWRVTYAAGACNYEAGRVVYADADMRAMREVMRRLHEVSRVVDALHLPVSAAHVPSLVRETYALTREYIGAQ